MPVGRYICPTCGKGAMREDGCYRHSAATKDRIVIASRRYVHKQEEKFPRANARKPLIGIDEPIRRIPRIGRKTEEIEEDESESSSDDEGPDIFDMILNMKIQKMVEKSDSETSESDDSDSEN